MDILGYIKDMIALGTVPAFISLGIIAAFVFLVIWHSVRGFQRGIFKQIFHVGFVIIAVAVAYFVTAFLWSKSLSILDGHTIESILALFGVALPENVGNALGAFDMQVIEYVLLLPVGVIVMPFVFMAVYFTVNLVLKLVYVITVGILRIPYADNLLSEVLGFILGLAEGLLVAFMILLPFADISDISTDAYHMIEETREERGLEETSAERFLVNYAVPLEGNPVLKVINSVGGEALLDRFASFEDGVGTLNMRDEYTSMVKLAFLDFASLHDADWMQLAEHHKHAIEDIVDSIDDSRYKTEILTELLGCMGHLLDGSNAATDAASKSIVLSLFTVFNGIEPDELNGVLTVFEEFYFHLSDEGILKAFENADNDALVLLFTKTNKDGKTNLNVASDIFNKNERTKILSTQITKLSISALSGVNGMDDMADAKYANVKGTMDSALVGLDTTKPKEEQVASMSETITSSMADNGMTIEPEVADDMAEYIVEKHGGKTTLTEEEFNDALLYYYQAKKSHDESKDSE